MKVLICCETGPQTVERLVMLLPDNLQPIVQNCATACLAGLTNPGLSAAILVCMTPSPSSAAFLAAAVDAGVPVIVVTESESLAPGFPGAADVIAEQDLSRALLSRSLRLVSSTSHAASAITAQYVLQLFDLVPEVVCVVDSKSTCLAINLAFERVLGYTSDEIVGENIISLYHPDDQAKALRIRSESLAGAVISEFECRVRSRSGVYKWLSWTTVRDTKTSIGYASGRDVTDQRKVKSRLELLDTAMKASSDGIFIVDMTRQHMPVVYANDGVGVICGLPTERIVDQPMPFLDGPYAQQPGARVLRSSLASGSPVSTVLLVSRPDETDVWCELHMSPIKDPAGYVTHYTGHIADITWRIVTERALRDSQERLAGILNSVTDIVYSTSVDEPIKMLYVSTAVFDVTGFKPEEFYSSNTSILSYVLADDLPVVDRLLQQVLNAGRAEAELRIVHANGSIKWLYCRVVLVKDADGIPVRIDGIATDISEQKMLRQSMMQAEKLAAVGELVAGVAHEINNPLAIICGHAQIIEMTQEGPVVEDAKTIGRMAKRASGIVNNLLTFARKQDTVRKSVSINNIINAALELAEYRLARHGVVVNRHLDPNIPLVTIGETEFEQVILNLLNNADHAMRDCAPSSRSITITSSVVLEGFERFIVIEVADTGVGIPEAEIGRIFDPFYTTKAVGEGTGLGLSICHGIVVSHGGSIAASSPASGGAVMIIRLPTAQIDAPT